MQSLRFICLSGLIFRALSGPLLAADHPESVGSFELLGETIAPGEARRLGFVQDDSLVRAMLDVPVLIAHGETAGPTLCVTAAVHGDELNGVEIARNVFSGIQPAELSGTLIVIPIVNAWGFRSGNRYLADRRDLNRAFPGRADGSTASRIAHVLFERVIRHCDALIDLHTGSNQRTNLPQIRADLENPPVAALAMHFAVGIVIHGAGAKGTLRRSATDAGVPTILYEAGGPLRFETTEIERGIEGVHNVMEFLEMVDEDPPAPDPQRVFRHSRWVRAEGGGIFLSDLEPGASIESGQLLGTVTDPVNDERVEIRSSLSGKLIGMAVPQVVLPGFGLFHIADHEGESTEPSEFE